MRKLTFLFALLCVSVVGWAGSTPYCGEIINDVQSAGKTAELTCKKTGENTYLVQITSTTDISGAYYNTAPLWMHINGVETYNVGAHFERNGNTITATVTSSTVPDFYTNDFYFYYPGEVHFQLPISDIDFSATCGGSTPLTTYAITVNQPAAGGGTIAAGVAEAAEGATVNLTATPDAGKALDEWIVRDAGDNEVTVTANHFTMPASAVTVTATFKDHDPNEYTAGGHTIHLDASYVGDIYTLVITSADDMEGLSGSYWNVNGVGGNRLSDVQVVSGDKKTITCQVQSTSAPNIYTPLYIFMPGEINFGDVTLNWEDRTPINSEYCKYEDSQTIKGGKNIALTWETDGSGNVIITMQPGTGTTSCSFRNGGFEGGIAAFVVSDDDFVTTTPASDYFTAVQVYSGNTYTLTKTADLPANAKIKHVGSGHALAWVLDGNNEYCFPDFIYTYGGTCNQLDAPTNVSIDANNIITFDAVAGADSYTAYVSLGGVEKYSQVVAPGDELTYTPLVDGDYDVTVVASGAGKTDSDPSTAFVWSLTAAPIVLGNSEYCEHLFGSGNQQAALTWETDGSGNIVITISDVIDGTEAAAHFRGNGMALGNFQVGAGKTAASTYFNHSCSGNQVTLSLKDPLAAPTPGEKIYFTSHVVEYTTKQNTNAYGDYTFEYTYGTVCAGKAVSATSNNNTMGTAVVQKAGVDVTSVDDGDEVTFIATVADAEQYRFINWTKGGVEVSTSATYVTTITETTNLIANFDYIRNVYCHAEINSIQNKKLYLTLGAIGGGQYQIKIEGSAEAQLTGLNNANYTINWVTTDIVDGDKKMSGQDVPFNNARWAFDASGYGSATATFGIADGHTWEDIYVWNHAIYFSTAAGEVGYTGFPGRNNIDWTATCADAEAPVFTKAVAEVLNESSVRLKIQATDNWEGLLTYTIARAGAEPIISNHASGEEFAEDVTGLTAGTEYTFTVTVSDGVHNTNQNIVVTPVADENKPVMGAASLESKTWNRAIINVAATDDKGVVAYRIVELAADFAPAEGKITVEGLTAATAYTFTIKAKDAAGNISDNLAEVSFTTDAHALVPTTAAPVPTWPTEQVKSLYSNTYAFAPASLNSYNEGWWSWPAMAEGDVDGNTYLHYNLAADGMIGWQFAEISVATMEKLHIDIFSSGSGTLTIRPITTGGPEVNKTLTLVGQQWNSFDIALTEFPGHDWTKLFQFAIEHWNAGGLTGEHISVDNVYFYRESALDDSEAPSAFTASRAEESFFSVKINAQASDNSGAVTFTVKNGDDVVATQNAVSAAATVINVTGLNAGTAYNFNVYVADEAGNTIDPIAVAATTKVLPGAAPVPTLPADRVKSIYSETYTTAITGGINFNEWWWQSPTIAQEVSLGGNNARYYSGLNTNGSFGITWSADNKLDAAGYQIVHFHIYPTNSATIEIYPVIAPEGEFHRTSQTLVGGQWNEVIIDFSDKTFAPFNQFGIVYTNALGDFFIDNLYFEKSPDLVRNDSWMAPGELGTICIPQGAVATGGDIYELVGKNSNGKIVFATVADNEMEPGKPYLFQATSNAMNFFYTDATPAAAPDNSGAMKGTFINLHLTGDDLNGVYYFAGHALWDCSDLTVSGLEVAANRAYVQMSDVQEIGSPTPKPGVRFITMDVKGEQVVTGCEKIGATEAPVKMMIDGQLFILRGEKLYDATGRMVK